MAMTRWNVAVSTDTDRSLRLFLADKGVGRKGGLSQFIEESVRAHILELTAESIKLKNARLSEENLTAIVQEAIEWAHTHESHT